MNCRIPPRHPFSGYLVRPTAEQSSPTEPSSTPEPAATASPLVSDGAADGAVDGETCDYCGSTTLEWRKCKLICTSCAQINKSCADL
jgi:hypothetical protein